jgi:hypothetical protein
MNAFENLRQLTNSDETLLAPYCESLEALF